MEKKFNILYCPWYDVECFEGGDSRLSGKSDIPAPLLVPPSIIDDNGDDDDDDDELL